MASSKENYTELFLWNNPRRTITQFQINNFLFPITALKRFKKFSLDFNVFSDVNFIAAKVSDNDLIVAED